MRNKLEDQLRLDIQVQLIRPARGSVRESPFGYACEVLPTLCSRFLARNNQVDCPVRRNSTAAQAVIKASVHGKAVGVVQSPPTNQDCTLRSKATRGVVTQGLARGGVTNL